MALNAKQELFKEEYLKTFNAAKAAVAAGYSEKNSRKSGHQILRTPEMQAAIKERLREVAIGADEMIALLSEQATGDIGDFLTKEADGTVTVDVTKGNTRLIKKLTQKRVSVTSKHGKATSTTVTSIELYDAQTAIRLLGSRLGLFKGDANDGDGAEGDWWDAVEAS